jgi:NADH dehydrogenase FAD-containing subunit
MVGQRTPQDFTRPLDRLLRRGIEFRQGNVTRIDPAQREVEIDGQTLRADNVYLQVRYEF